MSDGNTEIKAGAQADVYALPLETLHPAQADLFAANGHIDEEIGRVQPKVQFKELPLLFRNSGKGKFEDVSKSAGAPFAMPIVARGASYADYDRDGDLDVLVSTNHGPAHLWKNENLDRNHWITLRLKGVKSNKSALGSVVRLQSNAGRQTQTVHSGSSYCSQSDLALTFGLGKDVMVGAIEIDWPSGTKQKLAAVKADQFLTITEGQ